MSDKARADFHGAKALVFLGSDLLIVERDHTPGIPWPGYLDLPGGGREGGESPEACAMRETREEVGLQLSEDQLQLVHIRESEGRFSWFFAAHLAAEAVNDIVFGDEGVGWSLMVPERYVAHPKAIPPFAAIVAGYLADNPRGRR